jgi:ribonuclease E
MTKRMLIDATHAEETRVVVLDGNRLEDFDVETAAKKQLKGNIYLAKVVRIEPSLQAAFVEYGGGRHGFLAFGEIHPDYYQIPVADRQRLMEMQEAEARAEEEADDAAAAADEAAERGHAPADEPGPDEAATPETAASDVAPLGLHSETAIPGHGDAENDLLTLVEGSAGAALDVAPDAPSAPLAGDAIIASDVAPLGLQSPSAIPGHAEPAHELSEAADPAYGAQADIAAAIEADLTPPGAAEETPPESDTAEPEPRPRAQPAEIAQDIIVGSPDAYTEILGADLAPEAMEPATSDTEFAPHAEPADAPNGPEDEHREDEAREARAPARFMRSYKIQEVIRRRQILLIQVVKEERGSKGAALTTYISLAGRFSVLMPNSPRGGGISRKITSTADRRRLKEVTSELQIPRGMGLIVRTAGANRPKAEIKRDCEYLLELWDSIRETTMKSIAPALIHEEASLIKRAIRDNYSRDVDEVLVDGEAGWRAARDFMRMLMPAHARKVVLWNNPQPLFAHQAVEAQLDSMLVPTVQLKSGGYLVINQTEALVAVDVNSGRSTRERGIEETALKTNLEAADEVARQLRLRDLAGLIVIDFIDMESRRNNAAVEKRMKDALKDDRARIQLGSISSFGLMEMSRQRLRPSLAETSFTPCPHCGGTGHVRSTETSALAVLRAIEDEGAKRRAAEICVYVAGAIALYILNHKRVRIAEIEARYGMTVTFAADESLLPPQTRIERLRAQIPGEAPEPAAIAIPIRDTRPVDAEDEMVMEEEDEADDDAPAAAVAAAAPAPGAEPASDGEPRKRRRRRRGGRREDGVAEPAAPMTSPAETVDPALADQPDLPELPLPAPIGEGEAGGLSAAAAEEARGRRRGRRGGRRRRRDEPGGEGNLAIEPSADDDSPEEAPASFDAPSRPVYTGPTPADPFGGGVFDIYDVMEQAEARAAAAPPQPPPPAEALARPEADAAAAITPSEAVDAPIAAAAAESAPLVETAAVHADAPVAPEAPVAAESAPADAAVPAPPEPVMAQAAPMEQAAAEMQPDPAPLDCAVEQPVPLEHAAQEVIADPPASRLEPVAGPISAPVIIGPDSTAGEKKRGWWKR